ncbi:MAG: hypothetical protein P4L64_06865 [Caulobacteraceae bacterium]|nr:hypothetical protein [Caulobacteraceae bacterium]
MTIDSAADEHVVHEAFGPPLSPIEGAASIAMGVVGLLAGGLLAVLLGALSEEHRLSAGGIGLSAMAEALCMAATTGAASALLKPRNLRWIGAGSALALMLANLLAIRVQTDGAVIGIRALTGVPEGLLLWITISMIARTQTPERWAAVLFTALTASQLAASTAFAAIVIPRFGANGALELLAGVGLLGAIIAPRLPPRLADFPKADGQSGAPPPRGLIALLATLFYVAAAAAVGIYLVPLAREAGLPAGVARTATAFSLGGQVLAGALATAIAGRVGWLTVFIAAASAYLTVFVIFGLSAPAWLFIAANTVAGMSGILVGAFLVPMTIEADPSRRAAVQSGAVQLLGAAIGPLIASRMVGEHDVRAALYLGASLLIVGTGILIGLHMTRRAVTPPQAAAT